MNIVKIGARLVMLVGIAVLLLTAGCAATTTPTGLNSATKTTAAVRILDWKIPSEREDGTALPFAVIAGYKIYYGSSSGNYTASLNVNSVDASGAAVSDFSLAQFSQGTYYFVMTTLDSAGRESLYSNEVKVVI